MIDREGRTRGKSRRVRSWSSLWLDYCSTQINARFASRYPLSPMPLAIPTRQVEKKEEFWTLLTAFVLYQEKTVLLTFLLQVHNPEVVAAMVLLSCLETMSARAQDWRRRLVWCAVLFNSHVIHLDSGGLLQRFSSATCDDLEGSLCTTTSSDALHSWSMDRTGNRPGILSTRSQCQHKQRVHTLQSTLS